MRASATAKSWPGTTATSGDSHSGTPAGRRRPDARAREDARVVGDRDELRAGARRACRMSAARSGEHAPRGRHDQRREAAVDHRDRPVQQVGGRVGLGDQVARLLHLERDLERGRVVEAAPDHHEVLGVAVAGDLLVERCVRLERRRDEPGHAARARPSAARRLERGAQHRERAERRGVGLGRRDRALGAGERAAARARRPRQRRAGLVRDRDRQRRRRAGRPRAPTRCRASWPDWLTPITSAPASDGPAS